MSSFQGLEEDLYGDLVAGEYEITEEPDDEEHNENENGESNG